MKRVIWLSLIWGWMAMSFCQSQINSNVESFSLKNLLDDTNFNLADYTQDKATVLIITSTYCPFAKSYQERLSKLADEYSKKGVRFVLINPENPQDSPEAMKQNAQTYNLPYLLDTEQKVTQKLQATKTPEVFVLQYSLGHFLMKYHGAIDDNPQVAEEVEHNYLKEALDALLAKSSPSTDYQKPTGCMIKN